MKSDSLIASSSSYSANESQSLWAGPEWFWGERQHTGKSVLLFQVDHFMKKVRERRSSAFPTNWHYQLTFEGRGKPEVRVRVGQSYIDNSSIEFEASAGICEKFSLVHMCIFFKSLRGRSFNSRHNYASVPPLHHGANFSCSARL